MSETLGALVRRLRCGRVVTVRRSNPRWKSDALVTLPLSQQELARRACLDVAWVHRIERDDCGRPSRSVLVRIADALEISDLERARLLVAGGYWPWPDADEPALEFALAVVAAVLDGDYRTLGDDPSLRSRAGASETGRTTVQ